MIWISTLDEQINELFEYSQIIHFIKELNFEIICINTPGDFLKLAFCCPSFFLLRELGEERYTRLNVRDNKPVIL